MNKNGDGFILDALPELSHITGNFFLGAIPKEIQRNALVPNGFKYIFNFVGKCSYYIASNQRTMICPFNDSDVVPDEEMLHEMADAVLAASKKGPTLCHCAAGINRSALVLGLALVKSGMHASDAIALMRMQRGAVVLHNKTFENWLLKQGPQKTVWTGKIQGKKGN